MKYLCARKYVKPYYLFCFWAVLFGCYHRSNFLLRSQEYFSYDDCLIEYQNLRGSFYCIIPVYRSGSGSSERDTHTESQGAEPRPFDNSFAFSLCPCIALILVLSILHIMGVVNPASKEQGSSLIFLVYIFIPHHSRILSLSSLSLLPPPFPIVISFLRFKEISIVKIMI